MRLPKQEALTRADSVPLPTAGNRSALEQQGHRDRGNLFELLASPTVRQALRPVAERLLALSQNGGVFCVSSAQSAEGRTLVAATLGLMLSENADKNVLLVDAHLHKPLIHQLFGVPDSPGLADCVREECLLGDAVRTVGTMRVLTSGKGKRPARLLRTAAAKRLIEEIRKTYDVALIDLPPLTSSNEEAASLCEWSDGAIMVVRANATSASTVMRAAAMIDSRKLLGIVLNQEESELPRWLQRLL
ncbi:MAG: CpsD/CapB family tyrosine-protein kinase [Dehalococcoidia bacterium]|jgi:Mrp family chromosome partitioning ATPase